MDGKKRFKIFRQWLAGLCVCVMVCFHAIFKNLVNISVTSEISASPIYASRL